MYESHKQQYNLFLEIWRPLNARIVQTNVKSDWLLGLVGQRTSSLLVSFAVLKLCMD